MTKKYPFVPRVAFTAKETGLAHIVCGNGAHYVWIEFYNEKYALDGYWKECEPLPHSLRWQQIRDEDDAKAP